MIKGRENYPLGDIIQKNATIEIPSVFLFEGHEELFAFLLGCRVNNCIVRFGNERITIKPISNPETDLELLALMMIKEQEDFRKMYKQYESKKRYMSFNDVKIIQ